MLSRAPSNAAGIGFRQFLRMQRSSIRRCFNLVRHRAAVLSAAAIIAPTILTGCLNLQLGGGSSTRPQSPTVGQQLIDLKKARESGAITDAEYQAARARLLGHP